MGSPGSVVTDALTAPFAGGTAAWNFLKNAATPSNKASGEMQQFEREQAAQAATLQNELLQAPKQIAPDNFLATQASQLAKLRLGLASTITTGAGGAPPPVLSAPSLTAGGGKTKTGQ
jgi:hypothetical protein